MPKAPSDEALKDKRRLVLLGVKTPVQLGRAQCGQGLPIDGAWLQTQSVKVFALEQRYDSP
jgi:hypothetical protein